MIKKSGFRIPIKYYYEKDMETESFKERKKEILDLFKNYNKLRSEDEFEEIKNKLHRAIREGDVDLIKIYLSETVKNTSNGLQFKIDETNRTASLFEVSDFFKEVIVPRAFEHKSFEFFITSVTGTSIKLKKLKFVEDSAVKTIYGDAFPPLSNIEEIYIPPSLKELKHDWCSTEKLTKITISPSNGQFMMKEDKYLIGKSDSKKDEFDILLFANRYIENISIPSNIKIISSYAFCKREFLKKVEIPPNSNLREIEKYAFTCTKIEQIFIPPKVTRICEYAFFSCSSLERVEIPTNSNLQTIESYAFSHTNIIGFFIPSKVSKIFEKTFFECDYLQIIEISEESRLESFPLFDFSNNSNTIIMIPASLDKLIHTKKSFCSIY